MTTLLNGISGQQSALGNDDNMIPLINIVFLLLIFFMIAGHISQNNDDITVPDTQTDKPADQELSILQIDAAGQLMFQHQPLSLEALQAENLPSSWPSPSQGIAIQADKTLTADVLSSVLQSLRAQQFASIVLYAKQGEPQ